MNKKIKKIIIFAGGEQPLHKGKLKREMGKEKDECFFICADSGLDTALAIGIKPDLFVGDADSLSAKAFKYLNSADIEKKIFPAAKDESDLELALDAAVEKKPKEIIILGALGKRTDHELFNIMLLFKHLKKNILIKIIGNREEILAAKKETVLKCKRGTVISLLPCSDKVKNVYLEGFKYGLSGEDLFAGSARGLSNVIVKSPGKIRIDSGRLLVIINRDNEDEL